MVEMKKDSNLNSALEIWTDALNQIANIFNNERKKRYSEVDFNIPSKLQLTSIFYKIRKSKFICYRWF